MDRASEEEDQEADLPLVKYSTLYTQYLEHRLESGGIPAVMEQCVNDYNLIGRPEYTPTTIYREWVTSTIFLCSRCGERFHPQKDVLPEEIVICGKCPIDVIDFTT